MNGIGLLVKEEVKILGEFFADQFVKELREEELGSIRDFIFG